MNEYDIVGIEAYLDARTMSADPECVMLTLVMTLSKGQMHVSTKRLSFDALIRGKIRWS